MSGLLQKGARRFTTQIAAAGVPDAVATTIPLVSVTGLPTDTTVEIVVDRTDSNGVLTPTKEEVVRGTVSGTNLINCVRGVEGTAQAHSAGATVNSFLTASMWNNIIEYTRDLPTRGLINGLIVPTVASNNLTVAIKTLQNTDPTPANPVYVWINNTLRTITSPLFCNANAGFNLFNSGSAELATREVDYFVYVGNRTSDNTLFLGFSRIPYSRIITDFSDTANNERYVRFGDGSFNPSTVIGAIANIGRFATTLSAGPSHNWSVPTFTNANLIQEPIYETRYLDYTPTWVGSGTNPAIGNGTLQGKYIIRNRNIRLNIYLQANTTTTYGSGLWAFNTPMSSTSGQTLGAGTGSGHAWNGTSNPLMTGVNYIFGSGNYAQIIATTNNSGITNGCFSPTNPFTFASGSYATMGIEYIIT